MEEHLSKCQHGFMKGRSCITQLLETLDMWTETLDKGGVIDAIYLFLDFAKAFDSVPHERLFLHEACGIRVKALGWIRDFLHERRQRVSHRGGMLYTATGKPEPSTGMGQHVAAPIKCKQMSKYAPR